MRLQSFPDRYRALVIGATGAIGAAIAGLLAADAGCAGVERLHRRSLPPLDLADEGSIAAAAQALAARGPFHLVINAAGVLHGDGFGPEKSLGQLNYAQLDATFRVNAFGPALLLRHFAPLLARERGVFAMLSAKVGSIGDNRLGGWYSYRASKAALNMLVKTAAIELRRTQPEAVLVALHPGTVASPLSRPFRGDEVGRAPLAAGADLLRVIDGLQPRDSGAFRAYDGASLPW